jgi:hypothetical protein
MGTRFQEEEVGQSSYNMGLEWMGCRILKQGFNA